MKVLIMSLIILTAMLGIVPLRAQNWEAAYERLSANVEKHYAEPKGNPRDLAPYLAAMDLKAEDRNEIEGLYEQLVDAAATDPSLQALLPQWSQLYQRSQLSGESTVIDAKYIFLEDRGRSRGRNWTTEVLQTNQYGRPLYEKALATEFMPDQVRDVAYCKLNFALIDVEAGKMGLYVGREIVTPIPEEGDFFLDCISKGRFHATKKGQPKMNADIGLEWVDFIRIECQWWQFGDLIQAATDLMNQYYKDTMCKLPPDKGHLWYHELAMKYEGMEPSVEHNEGFKGTLKGLVEWDSGNGREPAGGATVTLYYPKDQTGPPPVRADEKGRYEIEDAVLHKDCSPFQLNGKKYEATDDREFEGPLKEPKPGAVHTEDLFLKMRPTMETHLVVINPYGKIEWHSTSTYDVSATGLVQGKSKGTVSGHLQTGSVSIQINGVEAVVMSGRLQEREGMCPLLIADAAKKTIGNYRMLATAPRHYMYWNFWLIAPQSLAWRMNGQSEDCIFLGEGIYSPQASYLFSGTSCCPNDDPPCSSATIQGPPWMPDPEVECQPIEWREGKIWEIHQAYPGGVTLHGESILHLNRPSG